MVESERDESKVDGSEWRPQKWLRVTQVAEALLTDYDARHSWQVAEGDVVEVFSRSLGGWFGGLVTAVDQAGVGDVQVTYAVTSADGGIATAEKWVDAADRAVVRRIPLARSHQVVANLPPTRARILNILASPQVRPIGRVDVTVAEPGPLGMTLVSARVGGRQDQVHATRGAVCGLGKGTIRGWPRTIMVYVRPRTWCTCLTRKPGLVQPVAKAVAPGSRMSRHPLAPPMVVSRGAWGRATLGRCRRSQLPIISVKTECHHLPRVMRVPTPPRERQGTGG
jgi:hypothetical protein